MVLNKVTSVAFEMSQYHSKDVSLITIGKNSLYHKRRNINNFIDFIAILGSCSYNNADI